MPATEQAALGAPRPVEDAPAHIAAERKLTFNAAPWYQRVIILAAGVIFNLLFAVIIFTTAFMITGTQVPTLTLASVIEGSPAAAAGIQSGDTVLALEGQPVDSWATFTDRMANRQPGEAVTITVQQATTGAERDFTVRLVERDGRAILGITTTVERVAVPFGEALTTSLGYIGVVATAITQLFNPATFGDVVSQSTSVIGVSFEAKNYAEAGFLPFIVLAAALSISIGLMNLLPFPPLDGGKIVLETIERVTRRTMPVRVVNGVTVVALALLVMLFIFVTNQDIQNYIIDG
jgi:regulator of sigma E protease